MVRYLLQLVHGDYGLIGTGLILLGLVFCAWMFVHAIRTGDYIWAALIFFFSILTSIFYYLLVYRNSEPMGNPFAKFEVPGAADRRRIKQLQADIHHLDKAHSHLQLGDLYFRQGKYALAEKSYRAAYEREPKDEDTWAHLGDCLARMGKPKDALPLLTAVCARNPKHDYGVTLMTLAEVQAATGDSERALQTWRQVLGLYGYPRARVQFAELLIRRGEYAEARAALEEVVQDIPHATKFEHKREKEWFNRAEAALRQISGKT